MFRQITYFDVGKLCSHTFTSMSLDGYIQASSEMSWRCVHYIPCSYYKVESKSFLPCIWRFWNFIQMFILFLSILFITRDTFFPRSGCVYSWQWCQGNRRLWLKYFSEEKFWHSLGLKRVSNWWDLSVSCSRCISSVMFVLFYQISIEMVCSVLIKSMAYSLFHIINMLTIQAENTFS